MRESLVCCFGLLPGKMALLRKGEEKMEFIVMLRTVGEDNGLTCVCKCWMVRLDLQYDVLLYWLHSPHKNGRTDPKN